MEGRKGEKQKNLSCVSSGKDWPSINHIVNLAFDFIKFLCHIREKEWRERERERERAYLRLCINEERLKLSL